MLISLFLAAFLFICCARPAMGAAGLAVGVGDHVHHPGDSKSAQQELSEGFYSDVDETVVSAGEHHTCAVDETGADDFGGQVVCWGSNSHGQSRPPQVTAVQVSSGSLHSCALRSDETLACWGYADLVKASTPAGEFSQVSAGGYHTCAIRRGGGEIVCWGKSVGGGGKDDDDDGRPPSSRAGGGNLRFVQVSRE